MNEMDNRRTILHVLAGGYLLYLAYSIVKGIISGETPADRALLMGVCAAAFGLVGAYLLIHALIVRVKTAQNPPEEPEETEEEEEDEGQETEAQEEPEALEETGSEEALSSEPEALEETESEEAPSSETEDSVRNEGEEGSRR